MDANHTTSAKRLKNDTPFSLRDNDKMTLSSTIAEEKRHTPKQQVQSAEEYAKIMNSLNLDRPKKIDITLPANLQCGLSENINV